MTIKRNNPPRMKIITLLTALTITLSNGAIAETFNIYNATELQNALKTANAGDEIIVNPGTYIGNKDTSGSSKAHFYSNRSGNPNSPIIIRSYSTNDKQILQGESIETGYVFYLQGDYWQVKDLKFYNAQKGIVLEGANHNEIDNVEVANLGAEAVHFRYYSSYNLLSNCYIHNTGKRVGQEGFGEGVYVGTHDGHTAEKRDPSDHNRIGGCTIGPNITAEAFDIKAGVVGTVIEYNYITADGIIGTGSYPNADSFIDLKGTDNIVRNNLMEWGNDPDLDHGIFTYQEHRNSNIYNNELRLPIDAPTYKLLEEMVHSVNNVRLDGGTNVVYKDYQNKKWDENLDTSIEKPVMTYSCFDELSAGCGTEPTTPVIPIGPEGYSFAVYENELLVINQAVDVAYGANGVFTFLTNQTADLLCNNTNFSDPMPNVEKACFIKPAETNSGNNNGNNGNNDECSGTIAIPWDTRTEVNLADNNCISFAQDLSNNVLQAWDSDTNPSCDFRGTIESTSNSSVSALIESNYQAINDFSGQVFKLTPNNNCLYIKVRAY